MPSSGLRSIATCNQTLARFLLAKSTVGMVSNWKSPNQIEKSLTGDQIDAGVTKFIFIIFEKLKQ
jgi:hypothetical protein